MRKLLTLLSLVTMMSCSKPPVSPNQTITVTSGTQPCNGKRTVSVQCIGYTQSGNRCQNKTLSCNSKCYLHGGN
jgi:hypothetical protein